MEYINRLSFDDFIELFGNVIEHGKLVAGAIWARRPFYDAGNIWEAVCEFLDALPLQGKVATLRLYPDLAGKLAKSNRLSEESHQEHRTAGLLALTADETRLLTAMNKKYRERFLFPFIICARQNQKDAILSEMKARMQNTREIELEKSLEEVKKIAWHRIVDLIRNQPEVLTSKY
ncbi:2-oxo-4-hydroxy-4-carboxy-5-ureidoimidazoline decarboxylase-like [Patiria miniata]|uniref:2-oxo-4-hydroxy-4-carboxy-5-ureidoimidazoline decarboxylase n=1 Tax=Patiria miniata TaxID=46514 RepID=A0A914ASK6_PATMI|nr:2-oxo-4-hydroxy-4-carboxy-5-ureidoimidazoline decarboxylase-like [Patiria miniata]